MALGSRSDRRGDPLSPSRVRQRVTSPLPSFERTSRLDLRRDPAQPIAEPSENHAISESGDEARVDEEPRTRSDEITPSIATRLTWPMETPSRLRSFRQS